jgi:hypothetical protein
MQIAQAEAELLRRLEAAGLDPDVLDPWESWKVFKAYLQAPVDGDVYDAASFQCGRFEDAEDGQTFSALFLRQFSEREGEEDVGIRRVVVEFAYGPTAIRPQTALEVWTHDFATPSEFASVVEASLQFQALLNVRPRRTDVYGEEL